LIKKVLDERYVKVIFMEIVKAVRYLHQIGFCHRDLSPVNISLSGEEFIIKLLDFGFSSKIIRIKNGRVKYQTGKVGTKGYAIPEVIYGIPYDGEKADIFSLGVILFFLRIGFRGFKEAKCCDIVLNPTDLLYNYIRYKHPVYWKILERDLSPKIKELSEQFKNLYLNMLAYNPKERPTLDMILNDDYFSDIRALTDSQLQVLKQEIIKEFRRRESLIKKSQKLT
jgi:serine/threonine protein kinase